MSSTGSTDHLISLVLDRITHERLDDITSFDGFLLNNDGHLIHNDNIECSCCFLLTVTPPPYPWHAPTNNDTDLAMLLRSQQQHLMTAKLDITNIALHVLFETNILIASLRI
ncbi:hypothetical protein FUT69_10690 [Xylella taiwanensis]|uniref:Uncharacterized protein n=1 Tax=Xylella taiwanensis TaxID=1444770 RepID=Z9JHP1_9GAMM|nr:hypothetical protein [Xylella taiwanensis]EWS77336.1 hypothetical protein AF72_11250 [Xylella taiwanensis]MCD8455596.1 hypothetical protein [Xylella taiwanensis]MCD8458003.1 hypothetical protein [Xylella taiwanensis]MCD8460139.1 hypothetical protein [Xylella taiwanensis]MCD8463803.1 hypothetical protein [Xylella taiwanensis]